MRVEGRMGKGSGERWAVVVVVLVEWGGVGQDGKGLDGFGWEDMGWHVTSRPARLKR